jgi:hypothetical protein
LKPDDKKKLEKGLSVKGKEVSDIQKTLSDWTQGGDGERAEGISEALPTKRYAVIR